jgi:hypothetical protein
MADEQKKPPPFPLEAYNAALEQEREARDTVFLGATLDICGEPVLLLTARMFLQLTYPGGSPFLLGGDRSPEHVAQILWRLSPLYQVPPVVGRDRARIQFVKRIAPLPFLECCAAIESFLDLMLFDAPPSSGQSRAPTVSFGTKLVDFFARNYGWSIDAIMDAPMPQLFQLMKEINRRTNPDACSINRLSDKVKQAWGRELEEWSKKNHSQEATEKTEAGKNNSLNTQLPPLPAFPPVKSQ